MCVPVMEKSFRLLVDAASKLSALLDRSQNSQ